MQPLEQVGELLERGDRLLLRVGSRIDGGGLLQIHARAEGRACPRQHDRPDVLIRHSILSIASRNRAIERPRKGVALIGAIQGENRDRALDLRRMTRELLMS